MITRLSAFDSNIDRGSTEQSSSHDVGMGDMINIVQALWQSRASSHQARRRGRCCMAGDPEWKEWLRHTLLGTRLNVLLLAAPVAVVSNALSGPEHLTFLASLLALCPLAERLGWATEQLAEHTGPVIGGLLNATFGNATELIVSVLAIKNGLLRVVQQSLLGSVLSNLLLVLGTAFFCGGLRYKQQRYNREGVMANSTLLILGVIAVLLPTTLRATDTYLSPSDDLWLSRFSSVCMLFIYLAFIYFQLISHSHIFESEAESETSESPLLSSPRPSEPGPARFSGRVTGRHGDDAEMGHAVHPDRLSNELLDNGSRESSASGGKEDPGGDDNGDEFAGAQCARMHGIECFAQRRMAVAAGTLGEGARRAPRPLAPPSHHHVDLPAGGVRGSLVCLAVLTLVISVLSEYIVSTIEAAATAYRMPVAFVSTILLPIVGNAAEHGAQRRPPDMFEDGPMHHPRPSCAFYPPQTHRVDRICTLAQPLRFSSP